MIAGHFTTALIAKQKFPKGTLLYFLIISQLQDFLWFTFHYLGLEPTNPSDAFDATLNNMVVDMLYSHDLLPQLFWLAIVFLLGKLLFKNTKIGLVSMILVSIHFVLDFFSGHVHHIFGADTLEAGLGLYASNPYLAILIEALFSIGAMWYFFREEAKKGIIRTTKNRIGIISVFAYGIIFILLIATKFHDDFTKDEIRKNVANATPLKREGKAEEVADLVAYVASSEASFITGNNLDINGGLAFS